MLVKSAKWKREEKKPLECYLNLNEKPFVVHSVGFVKTNARYIKPIIYAPDKDQTNIDWKTPERWDMEC